MMRRLATAAKIELPTTPVASGVAHKVPDILPNVDDKLCRAIGALNRKDSNYWEFRDSTGRVEAHSYYQYPAMMVPSMQRVLLQTVLRLQSGVRDLDAP
jgi:hypothetical protein